jgi:hypothetical protein
MDKTLSDARIDEASGSYQKVLTGMGLLKW